MTARMIDAAEAERIGLINRVVPAEELEQANRVMATLQLPGDGGLLQPCSRGERPTGWWPACQVRAPHPPLLTLRAQASHPTSPSTPHSSPPTPRSPPGAHLLRSNGFLRTGVGGTGRHAGARRFSQEAQYEPTATW